MTQTASTGSKLQQVLQAGQFSMTAETSPPDAASAEVVLDRVRCLKGVADAVNVTDGASARVHMSALAAAAIMAREGIDPVLQLTTRDRNRLALQGDVVGASALGIFNFLCLTGDRMSAGDQPDAAEVFEIDSGALMRQMRDMRDLGSLKALYGLVKPGGLLTIDHYELELRRLTKFGGMLFRPILKRMQPRKNLPRVGAPG